MKTAVSIPNDVFESAEAAARQLGVSRSRFYAAALAEYVARWESSRVTERLNRLYGDTKAELDPAWERAQLESIDKGGW